MTSPTSDVAQGLINAQLTGDDIWNKAFSAGHAPSPAVTPTNLPQQQSGTGDSFEEQMFPQYDPNTILEPVEPPPGKEGVESYRFQGDGKIYDFKAGTPREKMLEKIWDHNSPGLWGSVKGGTMYSLPSDLSSALAYGLGGMGMDEMAQDWRGYSDDLRQKFQQKYGQFMTPGFEQALNQGKVWDFAMQSIGSGIPYMGMALTGAAAGAAAAPVLGATGALAAGLGGFLGSTAITSPALIAQFADRQVAEMKAAGLEDAEDRIDWYKAAGYGTLASGLQAIPVESIFLGGPLLQMVTRWGAKTGTPTSARLLASISDVAGTNALAGAGTQYLSRLNADMPLLDDSAKSEYLDAAIAGSLVGIPFGVYRGIHGVPHRGDVPPLKDKTLGEILDESEAIDNLPEGDAKGIAPGTPPSDTIIYNPNETYGIQNAEDAQAYLNNINYKAPDGKDRNGLEDFVRIHGSGYSDNTVVDAARRVARQVKKDNYIKSTPDGVFYPSIESLPQKHSDDPKILTKAAVLTDKYGYEDSFVRGLSDNLVKKLYKTNIDRELRKQGDLPKQLVEEFHKNADELVDPEVLKDVQQYGSLYQRPDAVKRNNLSVAQRKELVSKNPRELLAKQLFKKTQMKDAFDEADRPRQEQRLAEAEGKWKDLTHDKSPFIEEPPVDGEPFSDYAGMRKVEPAGLLEYKPEVAMTDLVDKAANQVGPRATAKVSKKALNEALLANPLIKKILGADATLEEIKAALARGKREQRKQEQAKEKAAQVRPLPDGTFARSTKEIKPTKEQALGKDDSAHLEAIRTKLEQVAQERNKALLDKHPELGPALNNMFKRFAELAGETKVLDQPTTKAMRGNSKLLDSLANRMKVTKALENAFLYLGKKIGTKFGDTLDQVLANQGEVTPKQFAEVVTLIDTAFSMGDAKGLRDINQGAIESLYKTIRNGLDAKDIKGLESNRPFLENWYKSTKSLNVKDLAGFTTEDLEAMAFSDYLRDSLVVSSKQFKNSKQERVFNSVETALKRIKKELGDQGYKSVDDLLEYNKDSGEKIPPEAARPGILHKRIVEEVQRAEDNKTVNRQSEAVQASADELNSSVPKNGFQEPPTGHKGESMSGPLEESANNVGNLWHYFSWLRSIPSLAREVPIFSEVFNNKLAEKTLASELQVRFSNKFSQAFDDHGGWQKLNDAHAILDHLRVTNQPIDKDASGRITYRDVDGKKRLLDHETSKAVEAVTEIYKEPYRAKDEIFRSFIGSKYKEEGLTPDSSLNHIKRVIDGFDQKIKGNPMPAIAARYRLQKEALESIHEKLQEIDSIVNRNTAYVPYMRFGDFVITVKDRATGDLVHMESINEQNKFGSKRRLPNEKEKKLKVQEFYKRFDNRKYEVIPHQLTYNDIGKHINNGLVSTNLIQSLLSSGINENMRTADHMATGIADPKAFFRDVSKDVEENKFRILKYVAARGAGKFGLKSENIPGYSKDWARVMDSFINVQANSLAKQAKLQDWGEIQGKIVSETMPQHLRDKVNKYADYINDPGNDYAGLRFFNFAMAMGLRPASALLQLNTLPQQTFALGLEYSPHPLRNMGELAKSIKRAGASVVLKQKLPDAVQSIIDREPGFFRTGIMQDVVRSKAPGQRNVGDKIYDGLEYAAGLAIQPAERVTRIATFDFFHTMFKDRPETLKQALKQREKDYNWQEFWRNHSERMSLEDAMSVYSMLETHGVYGKEGRGSLQRGLGGSLLFPFTTYAQQMMEVLGAQLTGQRGLPGLYAGLWTMGTYLGLAGAAGIPAYDLWKTLYEQYQSRVNNRTVDAEMEMKEAGVPHWMRKGLLSTATGLDLSSRVGQEVVAQNILEGIAKGEFKLNEVGGVPGRTLQALFNASAEGLNPSNTKSPMDLVAPILPGVVQDVYKGYKMLADPEDALKTTSGKITGDPSELGLGDALTRAAGFGSLADTEAKEKIFWQQRANQEFNQAKSRFAEGVATARYKMALGARNDDSDLQQEGADLLREMQREMMGYAKENKIVLDGKFWKSFSRNVHDRVWQKMNPGKIRKPTEGEKRHIGALMGED